LEEAGLAFCPLEMSPDLAGTFSRSYAKWPVIDVCFWRKPVISIRLLDKRALGGKGRHRTDG